MKASIFDEDFVGVHPGYYHASQLDSRYIAFKSILVGGPLIGGVEMNT